MKHPLILWLDRVAGVADRGNGGDDPAFIPAHRLEPLAGKYLEGSKAWTVAYSQTLLKGMRMVGEASRLDRLLCEHGLHPVWTRGALYGASLYGDCGVRPATDLDVYLSGEELPAAEALLAEQGYRLFSHRYPRWYYRRYHLQFPLRHAENGLLIDLHWAADHPLSGKRLPLAAIGCRSRVRSADLGSWHEPSPEDHLLLACAHIAKESSIWLWDDSVDPSLTGDAPGRFLSWLDLLLLLYRDHADLDWPQIEERAMAWGVLKEVRIVLGRVRALAPQSPCLSGIAWPAFVPPFHVASTSGGAIAPEQPGHHSRLGVRTSRVREWIHSLGRGDHSLIQTAGQIARITEAAAATALCLGYHQARRVIS